jgi:hypothetical protein
MACQEFREPLGSIGFFMMMHRPICLVSALAGVFLGGAAATGEEEVAPGGAAKQAASPNISSMISAGLPKYEPPSTTKPRADQPQPADAFMGPAAERQDGHEDSKATIVRLPSMIVRDPKLPDKSEILTKQEMARQGMATYIGPEDGLDRGVLNLFTVADLWQRLPFFGHYPLLGFETNEQRGLRLYQEAARRRELEDLNLLMSTGQKAAPKP